MPATSCRGSEFRFACVPTSTFLARTPRHVATAGPGHEVRPARRESLHGGATTAFCRTDSLCTDLDHSLGPDRKFPDTFGSSPFRLARAIELTARRLCDSDLGSLWPLDCGFHRG